MDNYQINNLKHKGKNILVPMGVKVVKRDDVIHLQGRYFFGGETDEFIILQPDPPYHTDSWFMEHPLLVFLSGVCLGWGLYNVWGIF